MHRYTVPGNPVSHLCGDLIGRNSELRGLYVSVLREFHLCRTERGWIGGAGGKAGTSGWLKPERLCFDRVSLTFQCVAVDHVV